MGTSKRERQKANRELGRQQQVKHAAKQDRKRQILKWVGIAVGFFALVFLLAKFVGGSDDDNDPGGDDAVVTAPVGATDSTDMSGATDSTDMSGVSDNTDVASSTDTVDTTSDSALPSEFAYGDGPCPPADRADLDEPVRDFDGAPQQCIDLDAAYTATFETTAGDFTVDLDVAGTPGTVNNFVVLARYGYYDGTPVFRAEPTLDLFQGGGESNQDSVGYTIPSEGDGYTYQPGMLAMANTGAPDSGGAQWFFVTGPQAEYLDDYGTYVVFGSSDDLDVLQDITASGNDDGSVDDPVIIDSVTITETPPDPTTLDSTESTQTTTT